MSATPHLDALTSRGRAFLGTRHAIMAGAMSWVSERHLVSAISNAGGFGVIACGAMTPALLEAEIAATQALTAKPFGVNLITMHPQLMELIGVCRAAGVSHVVLAGGIPPGPAVAAITGFARLIAFAPNLALAKKLLRSGTDALVIEGSEAGGHIGPVSLSVLVQEILPALPDATIFAAGGIGRGEAIAGLVEMGASGVQIGTRFAASAESIAHPAFKKAFIRGAARDAVASVQFDPKLPVIPVRALKNAGSEAFMQKQREVSGQLARGEIELPAAQLEIEHYWAGALRRAVIDGDIETGSLMAGQSVGMVTAEEPVQAILDALVEQAEAALAKRRAPEPEAA
ncbi:nitronate monooxygenase family protein [Sandaracinobacter sp. RS1-74]|uniref:NAD(P)H-dependent flavin oxidoreductase n=1 Tax=Sandaracinobacteroides sayramensis TaxID=2913411 RepID=UPI001EDA6728|nr:nitronate monooxygenase family protein [Sandaracinobacteroides sayramensis]